jgi:NAD(P)-dependent dehydrogenase (short-subunit alcohol dehydrogenase family)
LRDDAGLTGFVARVAEQWGGIDLVVSNVSTRPEAPEGAQRWQQAFEADLMHHVRLTELTLPHLLKGNQPSLIFLASLAANTKQLLPEEVAYGAFKAGLVNYAGHLSDRFGRKGLRVNAVSPSPIYFAGGAWDTYERERPKLFEVVKAQSVFSRFGTPQEVANAVVFLLSPAASFITGVNLRVDGGMDKSVNF